MKRYFVLFILTVLLVLAFHPAGTVSAAIGDITVISNIPSGVAGSGSVAADLQRAAGFTTGPDLYALTSVTLSLYNWSVSNQTVNVWLYSDNGGNPGSALTAFPSIVTTPGQDAAILFSLSTPFPLAPSTTYWVVVDSNTTVWGDMVWRFSDTLPTGIFSYAGSAQNVGLAGWGDEPNDFMFSVQAVQYGMVSAVGTKADGYIVETGENTSVGGTVSTLGGTLMVGDQTLDRQVRAVINFNNPALPSGAVVIGGDLKIKRQGVTGTNPLGTHGNLWVDLASNYFGAESAVKRTDFQAAPGASSVGYFNPNPLTGNWYSASLNNPAALPYLGQPGTIQFRLAFDMDDNDDNGADLLRFISGDYANAAYRPVLTVYYYIPVVCAPVPDAPVPGACAPSGE